MNSMHNSFSGSASGGGGYSSPYPSYVPPSALPYYNGYPGELAVSQGPGGYYGKPSPAMSGYSSGMGGYSAAGINNSMYYQQYGLGYQYGYGKYGLAPGLPAGLGYGSGIDSPNSIAPSSLGGLHAPTTDLGLTGSMFSKGSGSSSSNNVSTTPSVTNSPAGNIMGQSNCSNNIANNSNNGSSSSNNSKYPNMSNASSPHPTVSTPATMMSAISASSAPSPSPHPLPNSMRGHMATPSPPVEVGDGKKDLDKMRRCQFCGQVFRLMSECLAHMKAVHESPMSVYGMPHGNHGNQSMVPPHLAVHNAARSSNLPPAAPDSPLMALERMGWGKDQSMMSSLHSSSPITQSYPSSVQPHPTNIPPHLPDPRYGDPSQQSAKRLNDFYANCNSNNINHDNVPPSVEQHSSTPPHPQQASNSSSPARPRKSSSYSVSSIIGESADNRRDQRDVERTGRSPGEPPSIQSPNLPPILTPNLPVTSASLPPNLSPNLPSHLQPPLPSSAQPQQPPQLTPNAPAPSLSSPGVASNDSLPPHNLSPNYVNSQSPSVGSPTAVSSTSHVFSEQKHKKNEPVHTSNLDSSSEQRDHPPSLPMQYGTYGSDSRYTEALPIHAKRKPAIPPGHLPPSNSQSMVANDSHSHYPSSFQHSQQSPQGHSQPHLEKQMQSHLKAVNTSSNNQSHIPPFASKGEDMVSHRQDSDYYNKGSNSESVPVENMNNLPTPDDSNNIMNSTHEHSYPEHEAVASTYPFKKSAEGDLEHQQSYKQQQQESVAGSSVSNFNGSPSNNDSHYADQSKFTQDAASRVHDMQSQQHCDTEEIGSSEADHIPPKSSEDETSQPHQLENKCAEPPEGVSSSCVNEEFPSVREENEVGCSYDSNKENSNASEKNTEYSSNYSESSAPPHLTKEEAMSTSTDPETNQREMIAEPSQGSSMENIRECLEKNPQDDIALKGKSSMPSADKQSAEKELSNNTGENHTSTLIEESTSTFQQPAEEDSTQFNNTEQSHPGSGCEEEIGDEDEPGDPTHDLQEPPPSAVSPSSQSTVWPNLQSPAALSTPPPPTINQKPQQPPPTAPPVQHMQHSPQLPPQNSPHPPHPETMSPAPIHQQYYQQKLPHQSMPSEYTEKSLPHHSPQKPSQPGPYRGAWPPGYPSSNSPAGYQYHQFHGQPGNVNQTNVMASQPGSSGVKAAPGPGGSYSPRYPSQYPNPGFDNRRPMPGSYAGPGHWYPAAPGRGDTKPPWTAWAASQPHAYSQPYFYGGNPNPNSQPPMAPQQPSQSVVPPLQQQQSSQQSPIHHNSPMSLKYPPHQASPHGRASPAVTPTPTAMPQQVGGLKTKPNERNIPEVVPSPTPSMLSIPAEVMKAEDPTNVASISKIGMPKKETSVSVSNKKTSGNDRQRAKRGRAGPKSRVDRKQLAPVSSPQQQQTMVQQSVVLPGGSEDTDSQNGSLSAPTGAIAKYVQHSVSADSSDPSDCEGDGEPKLAVLKPVKRGKGPDGSFIGPKRIKLAKMVRQRQRSRQKLIQDQIKQSELEEQLTQQWVDRAAEQEGPLANVLLKSSLLLGGNNVEEPESVEECIASMTAQLLHPSLSHDQDDTDKDKSPSNNGSALPGKRPGRKTGINKVLHNSKSVVVKSLSKQKSVPKLRAKDFKWSHYIKTMRYWCKDCGHGFKNQKESQNHGEEQCKWNCLYMLECYVTVTDIVQHNIYGTKVS